MYLRLLFLTAGALCILLMAMPASADVYPEWINDYAGQPVDGDSYAKDCLVDNSGNIYVTGKSRLDGQEDMATIKYAPDGSVAWVARYSHEGIIRSYGESLIFDGNGDVYVLAGVQNENLDWTFALVKYASDGEILLDVVIYPDPPGEYRGRSIDIDSAGKIVISGPADDGVFAGRYEPDGAEIWLRRYESPSGTKMYGPGMALDALGNISLSFYDPNIDNNGPSFVLKYNSAGDLIWETTLAAENYQYELSRIKFDNSGNIYVLGESFNAVSWKDWLVCKLNGDGDILWTFSYHGQAIDGNVDSEEKIRAAAVDDFGNLYVTGGAANGDNYIDIVTMKILPEGTMDWIQQQDGGAQSYDYPDDIYLDGLGHVYVAGGAKPPNKLYADFFITKIDNSGIIEWARRYTGIRKQNNWAVRLFADAEENVYATGYTQNGIDASDTYTTIKFSHSDIHLGDVNIDGAVDVGDAVALINFTFRQGPGPDPVGISDANCDSDVNVGDIVYLINFVFNGGPPCDCMH